MYFPIFEFTGSSYVTYIAPQSENIFPFCDLSKCGLTGVFLYFRTAPVSENPPKKIPLKENLSKTYFSENKKTHLRNIHCPTDMSENFHICCRFARPGPTPSSISGIACSVCTVDLASCSNVMQCKENFCSLTGLPLNFSERIHHEPYVSQAKVFYFTGRYLQLSVYSMSGSMLRTAQFYIK